MSHGQESNDQELWAAVRRGDLRAFETVVLKHQSAVAAVAYSITGDFNLSEDVAQECFWQAYRNREQLREAQKLGGWLCGIARNLAHSTQRKKKHAALSLDRETLPVDQQSTNPLAHSISSEESQLIWNSLQDIPETYREVLVMYYRQGESIADVAEHLDLSTDAVKQRLSRGREYLRSQLTITIEGILQRTRPTGVFTAKVMTGLAALSVSLKASGTAVAATATTATTTTAVSTLVKSGSVTSASAIFGGGLLGGLAGILGGLGGAFIGSWLPAQLATAEDEYEIIRKSGRKTFFGALWFSLVIVGCLPLAFFKSTVVWYLVLVGIVSIVFSLWTIRQSLLTQRQLQQLRSDPKRQVVPRYTRLNSLVVDEQMRPRWQGLRYQSRWRVCGIPVLDIQFGDPMIGPADGGQNRLSAWGWIACGDRAVGILLAIGGTARGLIAFGGLAVGGVAVGGLALGAVGMGGLAIGLWAIGGGAVGYDAIGGGAIGWHSSAGGAALAYHVAIGGGAAAHDFAVGGVAWAVESNTDRARQIAATESGQWILDAYRDHIWLVNILLIVVSIAPLFLFPLIYRRGRLGLKAKD